MRGGIWRNCAGHSRSRAAADEHGQADESEVLEAEVEAQRTRMGARMQENTLREEWRSLAAVVGQRKCPWRRWRETWKKTGRN